ncbi:hypothetical protein HALA3H3_830072 [Halomonas sp. A3H3]|uniref:Uncharacterized protein n=1 Tax=Vreelandella titanicae TaxID=664683 RepID=A0AAP9NLG4_9GAMM|nr:hypothetical protein FX987_01567 [Halomonas titanicae]CDG54956.1 hypothetical protein HALA3H3_830072 [Halomonas sp. A3H3]SDI63697.1 hypothetical protein SAMN04487867_110104 [Halomonas titanicae]
MELILVVDHHHGVFIVVHELEARHADHFLSCHTFSRQWGDSLNARLTEQIFDDCLCAALCTKGDNGNVSGAADC